MKICGITRQPKDNLEKLESFGNKIIPVEKGELASGLYGEGRMAEPEQIVQYLIGQFFFDLSISQVKKHWFQPDLHTNQLTRFVLLAIILREKWELLLQKNYINGEQMLH